jgi:DNA polymerase III delta prime subunit
MKRPATFEDIKGHTWLVQYLKENITKGTLHHFLILEGPEGLGKTSLADLIALSLVYGLEPSKARDDAYKEVVVKKGTNNNIKRFECSVDGGKDVARLIKDEMNTTFTVKGPKVIICDECHGLTEQAQDVFLAETEYIGDDVYIIMLTTEITKLKASLRSRAVPIHLNPLKQSEMVLVLKAEVTARNLKIQNEDIVLGMIAEWSECKPRTGLNILDAFGNGSAVSMNAIRELIGYLDIRDVVPLLASLSGSMTFGLSYISEMQVNASLINNVIECINLKSGNGSYKIKMQDVPYVRDQLVNVSVEQLVTFLYGITKSSKLTRTLIINAYISAHESAQSLVDSDTHETLALENIQRSNVQLEVEHSAMTKAPTLDDLLISSKIIQ